MNPAQMPAQAGFQRAPMAAGVESGLLSAGQPPGGPQQGGQPQGEHASAEEQQLHDMIVTDAMKVLYSDGTHENVMQMLKDAASPAEGISAVVVTIGQQIEQNAQSNGIQIPDDVMRAAGAEILEQVAELAQTAGVYPQVSEEDFRQATYKTMQDWMRSHEPDQQAIDQSLRELPPNLIPQVPQGG